MTVRYTKEHEWVRVEGKKAWVGVSNFAQEELGDIVFVDLPQLGADVKQNESLCSLESVKAVSDVYAPLDGRVLEVNQELASQPELINQDPEAKGWLCVLELESDAQLSSLMTPEEYQAYVAEVAKH